MAERLSFASNVVAGAARMNVVNAADNHFRPAAMSWRSVLVFAIAGCAVPSMLSIVQAIAQANLDHRAVNWRDVIFAGCDWLILGLLVPAIYAAARRFPFRRNTWRAALAAHLAGVLVLCFGWASLGLFVGALLHSFPAEGPLGVAYLRWILITLPWSTVTYATVLAIGYATTYFVEARAEQAQAARLAAQLAEARLAALRSQLNPHFLFNSLNTVAVLVRGRQRARALEMINLLAEVLRRVLRPDSRHETSLGEEIALVEQYLRIEQVRFSDRLKVAWSIDPTTLELAVPAMILQPIVENAIKYGAARRRAAGEVHITAQIAGDRLRLAVQDDGDGFGGAGPRLGIGLGNTRERLLGLYGDRARLDVSDNPGGGACVAILLPLQPMSP